MHCMRRGSHPPPTPPSQGGESRYPPFARGGKSLPPLRKGGKVATPPSQGGESRRRLVFFPPLRRGDTGGFFECLCVAPGSASRRLKTALRGVPNSFTHGPKWTLSRPWYRCRSRSG